MIEYNTNIICMDGVNIHPVYSVRTDVKQTLTTCKLCNSD